ncbi:hypothetical protein VTO58DRAFT_108119 [Aureobasidium pullulans]|nr:hypothetical protein JADG_004847 [Aureobasidium pullulans]
MAHKSPSTLADSRPKHMSSPISLHGIDISSLDARDIFGLGMPSELTALPTASPDLSRTREDPDRQSSRSAHSPSLSAGRITDDSTVSHFDPPPESRSRSVSTWIYPYRKAPGSSPSLSIRAKDNDDGPSATVPAVPPLDQSQRPFTAAGPQPSPVIPSTSASNLSSNNAKPKPAKKRMPVLGRSKSLRAEDQLNDLTDTKSKAKSPILKQSKHGVHSKSTPAIEMPPMQKPLPDNNRKFMGIMRDRSQDRADADAGNKSKSKKDKSQDRDGNLYKNNNSSAFFDFRQSSSRATDGFTKASKGLLSKITRGGSNHGKPQPVTDDGDYVVQVLNKGLIEQTRLTRIAQSYDDCKDKTEFWMPALPWRAIDYLNGKCEEEGLYRVSGGVANVRKWRRRFDTELDINLLDESELYDASIIASLFKEWIRELPEDIFPKDSQQRITSQLPTEVPDKGFVPEVLRRELQHLPPFNYYLLFAITCHLSLLLEYQHKNKMTLDNLYRCFNQSLKLDGRIFYTLVGNWRLCWAGCVTENDYLVKEYDYLKHPYPQFIQDSLAANERAISSSESSNPPANGSFTPEVQRPATSHTLLSHSSENDEPFITPVKKNKRSSSDVTGLSPMRFNASPLYRGPTSNP